MYFLHGNVIILVVILTFLLFWSLLHYLFSSNVLLSSSYLKYGFTMMQKIELITFRASILNYELYYDAKN